MNTIEGSWKLAKIELSTADTEPESFYLNDAVFNFISTENQSGEVHITDDEGEEKYTYIQDNCLLILSKERDNVFYIQKMDDQQLSLLQSYDNYVMRYTFTRIGS